MQTEQPHTHMERQTIPASIEHWCEKTGEVIQIGELVTLPTEQEIRDQYEKIDLSGLADPITIEEFILCCRIEEITDFELEDLEYMTKRAHTWSEL